MRVVLKTNDPVVLSYATHVLEEAGIELVVFDTHASIMDGSMAMVPRRLMVVDEDFSRAEKLLRDAVPEADAVDLVLRCGSRLRAASAATSARCRYRPSTGALRRAQGRRAHDGIRNFLDGRVIVRQPETGFRAGLDAVMLAAAVPRGRCKALELGAGAGHGQPLPGGAGARH